MEILSINNIERSEWSRLVSASTTGTWFQGQEAYEFYASMPELFKPFAFGIENDGELRGVCVGYVTVEKNAIKQFMMRRAIIVGGPALADNCSEGEVEALMNGIRQRLVNGKWSMVNAPIYIETRNFNDYSRWKEAFAKAGFSYEPHLNFHVDTSSVDVVEANLGKSRKRDIRTSLRDGATIIEQPTLEQVREYYAILEHLYKTRVKTPLFPFSFFEKLWQHKDGRFILVALNEEIIGGTVCVMFRKPKHDAIEEREENTENNLKNNKDNNIDKPKKSEKNELSDTCSISTETDSQSAQKQAFGQSDNPFRSIVSVAQTQFDNSIQKSPKNCSREQLESENGGVLYEWFVCGRDGEWKSIFPSSLATYAGIRYAAEHGCARFDMMGAGKPDEAYGVRDFKARFGGKEVEHGRFLCVTKPVLYKIGVLVVKLLKALK